MFTHKSRLIVAGVLIVALLALWSGLRSRAGALTLTIVDQGADQAGRRSAVLLITNLGPHRICYPDGFFVQTKAAASGAYVPTTNLWLDPGEDVAILVTIPSITSDWCGVVSYYAESPGNRVKMRLSSSPIGQRLPSAFWTVRGAEVKSQWMRN